MTIEPENTETDHVADCEHELTSFEFTISDKYMLDIYRKKYE